MSITLSRGKPEAPPTWTTSRSFACIITIWCTAPDGPCPGTPMGNCTSPEIRAGPWSHAPRRFGPSLPAARPADPLRRAHRARWRCQPAHEVRLHVGTDARAVEVGDVVVAVAGEQDAPAELFR